MHEILRDALEPILRDIATLRAPAPMLRDENWTNDPTTAAARAWSLDGTGTGIYVSLNAPEPERIAAIAEQVQEWIIEQQWGTSASNWPPCPTHPDTHPLQVRMHDDRATWTCPTDGTSFWRVGSIPRPGDESPLP